MGNIALLVPTEVEGELILKRMKVLHSLSLRHIQAWEGRIKERKIALVITGVGKVNAAVATTLAIEKWNPDYLLLIGTGGAYPSSELKLLDLAMASCEIYGDEGCYTSQGWQDTERLGRAMLSAKGKNYYNCIPLSPPEEFSKGKQVVAGPFITVSAITGTDERARELEELYPGIICENMEGAAVAHVATIYGLNLLEIRGISNIVGERKREEWRLEEAAERVQEFILAHMTCLKL